ncbi:hypothetical protein IL252_16830 [Halomicrobium sp. IBSBa]|uniref:hypothetical protein n=1 Tax=Halomicrobium TaxID=203135 RepID=UPI0014759161|nr:MULTISPECIES: hypothetical protein [Halomicrobium]MBO4249474.1 hypothetical protein [Halomicrobium sp. IBSBa]
MARPSISVSDELLDEFDDKLIEMKAAGKLGRDVSRSELIARLMSEWVEERDDVPDPL